MFNVMITIDQLKLDLIKSLNSHFIIRSFFKTNKNAYSDLFTKFTVFFEKNIFQSTLKKEELKSENDIFYNRRTIISFLFKHERFTHIKKILNKSESDYYNSPYVYYNFRNNKYHIFSTKEGKAEIGESFEYLITDGKLDLLFTIIDSYPFKIDLKNLYNNNIWVDETNNKLIEVLQNIIKAYDEKFTEKIKRDTNRKYCNSRGVIDHVKKI